MELRQYFKVDYILGLKALITFEDDAALRLRAFAVNSSSELMSTETDTFLELRPLEFMEFGVDTNLNLCLFGVEAVLGLMVLGLDGVLLEFMAIGVEAVFR